MRTVNGAFLGGELWVYCVDCQKRLAMPPAIKCVACRHADLDRATRSNFMWALKLAAWLGVTAFAFGWFVSILR